MALMAILLAGLFVFTLYQKHRKPTSKATSDATGQQTIFENYEGAVFEISINSDAYNRLSAKRQEALKQGLLFSSKDDLVDADIKIDGEEYACKLRLKGDLLDHLKGNRWSFRIMLKNGKEWNGMSVFSIHNSQARSHTAEWLMHELFKQEGIVVPDYDFIKAKVNGVNLGVYAYEHHFENQMLRKNKRELGPILKHNDDAYWDNVLTDLNPFPWIDASDVEVFNKNNLDDPGFKQIADRSIGMLNDFLEEKKTAAEVFDIDLMARYYALLDLSHAWHAQQFTNIRFYLNPTSGKLEPIAFDCFGDHLPNVNKDWEAFGEGFNGGASKEAVYARSNVYRYHMLQDKGFFTAYMSYLEQFTNPSYLNDFKNKYEAQLAARARFIQTDSLYKDFNPNFDKLFAKANFTHKKLLPKQNLSLKAYRVNGSNQEIELNSYHYFPMEILGFGDEFKMTEELEAPLFLESYNAKIPMGSYRLRARAPIEYIYYRTLGIDQVFKLELSKANTPQKEITVMKPNLAAFVALPFVSQIGETIAVASGEHTITESIVIPAGLTLSISPGAKLQFINGASLCSYSPIIARGTAGQPIYFSSDGALGSGLLLSGAEGKSYFDHCLFIGLNAYQNLNVSTQGALVVYKTEAEFDLCVFKNIVAKETLSIRNSVVRIKQSSINECRGTGIKSSFSNLYLSDFEVLNAAKNGISIASGNLEATNVELRKILNKALNFTYQSKVYMHKVDVYDSYQSMYANDHSDIKIIRYWNQNIEKCLEVRSANEPHTKVVLDQFNHQDVDQLYLIKQGLSIMVNGKKEKG